MLLESDLVTLSRVTSHALRHEPWLYELELDDEGWVALDILVDALRLERPSWQCLDEDDVHRMIASSDKQRHELRDGRIRAMYGHSLAGRLTMQREDPPQWLFHGTTPQSLQSIDKNGLRPMRRQYVHLSADLETAQLVGRRKSKSPRILHVSARAAATDGIPFYRPNMLPRRIHGVMKTDRESVYVAGNSSIWLADAVPPQFISASPE